MVSAASGRDSERFRRFVDGLLTRLNLDADSGSIGRSDRLLEDLGLDSFDMFRTVVYVEEYAGALFPDVEPPILLTVGELYDYAQLLRNRRNDD